MRGRLLGRSNAVRPEGIDLNFLSLPVEETFYRQLKFQEFDVSEMSLSSYVLTLNDSDPPFTAIPVFPSRYFRHQSMFVNVRSGIRGPEDLRGRRVGLPEYQITAGVWQRGMLADQYGWAWARCASSPVGWMLRAAARSCPSPSRPVSPGSRSGSPRRCPGCSRTVNWMRCSAPTSHGASLKTMLPWLADHVEETQQALGEDFWTYGLEANRHVLGTFLRYSHEQGLAQQVWKPEEIFHPSALSSYVI